MLNPRSCWLMTLLICLTYGARDKPQDDTQNTPQNNTQNTPQNNANDAPEDKDKAKGKPQGKDKAKGKPQGKDKPKGKPQGKDKPKGKPQDKDKLLDNVNVTCQPLVKNANVTCSCRVRHVTKGAWSPLCVFPIVRVTLMLCVPNHKDASQDTSRDTCYICDKLGSLNSAGRQEMICRQTRNDTQWTIHEMKVIPRQAAILNNSLFACALHCGVEPLTVLRRALIMSSCTDGKVGGTCNTTCPPECEEDLCDSHTGQCIEAQASKLKLETVAMTMGIATPVLVGFCEGLYSLLKYFELVQLLAETFCCCLEKFRSLKGDKENPGGEDAEVSETTTPQPPSVQLSPEALPPSSSPSSEQLSPKPLKPSSPEPATPPSPSSSSSSMTSSSIASETTS